MAGSLNKMLFSHYLINTSIYSGRQVAHKSSKPAAMLLRPNPELFLKLFPGNVSPTRFHRLLNMTVTVQRFSAEGHEGRRGFPRISLSLKSNLATSPAPGLPASGFYPVCPANIYESPMISLAHRESAIATT